MERSILNVKSPKASRSAAQKITFEYFAPNAESVNIAGSFNDWKPEASPLKKGRDGKWKLEVKLTSGRYEYRYQVDGNWQNDQRPVECVPNAFGSWNCVVEVQ